MSSTAGGVQIEKRSFVIKRCAAILFALGLTLNVLACSAIKELGSRNQPVASSRPAEEAAADDLKDKPDQPAIMNAPNAEQAPYDLQFIDTISVNYQQGVDVARIAETRAQHPELKEFARQVVAAHEQQNSQLKTWRAKWYNDAPSAINTKMTGMIDLVNASDMKEISEATGSEFDLLFLDVMRVHRQSALVMWQEALTNAMHAELRRFAQQDIDVHETEIMQMNRWRSTLSAGS